MNITVVWIIIAICTITYCIALFKAASDIEKDLVREKFWNTNMELRDIQMRVDSVERRLSKMEKCNISMYELQEYYEAKEAKL